ncbi:MAG: ATP-binding protein [Leptolyngbyaceae cyanobacterium bins.302]|nr:ATP-binding protein [Leptolyngbyaceae cyanobacterium bins.302]
MANSRIFIVEDEILIAREIEGCLQELEYSVVGIAPDSETALQQISQTQPDLVLVDIVIQGDQDGIALAEQVQACYRIPVIYLTAYVDDHTLARAKLTQPFGYILKPFKKSDLRVAIEIALTRHQVELREAQALLAMFENYTNEKTKPTPKNQLSSSLEYLAILSHELRNPITAIQLAATMLKAQNGQIDEAKKQQLLQRIESSTATMNQLIEDVLTLGQTEHHTTTLQLEETDLVGFCRILLETFQWNTDKDLIDFICQLNHIYLKVDQRLLWQAFSNLVSNAIKYSSSNNRVIVRLFCTVGTVCFEVKDYGIGIPTVDLEYIFEPFHRGCNVNKVPGTGLGLSIAKRAAELHGGEITVESQVGYGTTFTLKLPKRVAS